MQRCKQMTLGTYEVSSSTSSQDYTITAFNGPPSCTCVSFAIGRNRAKSTNPRSKPGAAWCKHISHVYDTICQWDSSSDIIQREPGICPLCNGDTVFDGDETVEAVATETAIMSLTDMITEIESKTSE